MIGATAFIQPNLGNDIPSLPPYSIGFTGQMGKGRHKNEYPGGRGDWDSSWSLATTTILI